MNSYMGYYLAATKEINERKNKEHQQQLDKLDENGKKESKPLDSKPKSVNTSPQQVVDGELESERRYLPVYQRR